MGYPGMTTERKILPDLSFYKKGLLVCFQQVAYVLFCTFACWLLWWSYMLNTRELPLALYFPFPRFLSFDPFTRMNLVIGLQVIWFVLSLVDEWSPGQ